MKKRQRKKNYKNLAKSMQKLVKDMQRLFYIMNAQTEIARKIIEQRTKYIIGQPIIKIGGISSGITRINEAGGEIVNLPDGSRIIPEDIEKQIVSSGEKINIVISNKQ